MPNNNLSDNCGIDKLTSCFNAATFEADLKNTLKEAEDKYEDVTLVLLDIDNFKRVNDDFGHEAGDKMLKEIAQALIEAAPSHKPYRYSGEEFCFLFPGAEKEQVFLLMEETRKKVAETPECKRISTTCSMGIATYPEDGNRDVDLMRTASDAMYRAKNSGKNRICLAKEDKLVTKTAHYTVEQLKKLRELSKQAEITEAALLREALDELLKKYNTAKDNDRNK